MRSPQQQPLPALPDEESSLSDETSPLWSQNVNHGTTVHNKDENTSTLKRMESSSYQKRRNLVWTLTSFASLLVVSLIAYQCTRSRISSVAQAKAPPETLLLGSSRSYPCNQVMQGLWFKTCLIHVTQPQQQPGTSQPEAATTQGGMIGYIHAALKDGSFAELQNDGLGYISMYGSYTFVDDHASLVQNCGAEYTARYKQQPLDSWKSSTAQLTFNTFDFGQSVLTNMPNVYSCHYERIKGPECRGNLARLLAHLANDGASLGQFQNAEKELC